MEPIQYKVVNKSGEEVSKVDLDPAVFGAPVTEALVHDTVTWQRNRRRAGTHSCLSKGVMKGGGRKPWRQKGTGRARSGSNTSPVWVGGAVAHGPKPRDYDTRVPRRTRRQALAAALTDKLQNQLLVICDDLGMQGGKTAALGKTLNALGLEGKSALVVVPPQSEKDQVVGKAARNLPGVVALPPAGVNVYDIVRCRYIVSTVEGVRALQEVIKGRFEN